MGYIVEEPVCATFFNKDGEKVFQLDHLTDCQISTSRETITSKGKMKGYLTYNANETLGFSCDFSTMTFFRVESDDEVEEIRFVAIYDEEDQNGFN